MIKLENVCFSYGKKNVINNFSYQFNDRGLYVLKGKSGSGKTTLLNLIYGVLKQKSGNIHYSDDIIHIYQSIGYIFQESNLFDQLTVFDNIKLILNLNHD